MNDAPDWRELTGQANPLQRHAKTDLNTLMLIMRCFCYGQSTTRAATLSGLSVKSIRNLYFLLRERLMKDRFAAWHGANRRLLNIASQHREDLLRDAFFTALASCHFNENCFRNFRDGKRAKRQCRKCPLSECLSAEIRVEAIAFSDAVRAFYKNLNIAADNDGVEANRCRAIHTAVITTSSHATPLMEEGRYDYASKVPLSFRTLFETLLADLADTPLDVSEG